MLLVHLQVFLGSHGSWGIDLLAAVSQVLGFQVWTTAPGPVFIYDSSWLSCQDNKIFLQLFISLMLFEWIKHNFHVRKQKFREMTSHRWLWLNSRIHKLYCTLKTEHGSKELGSRRMGCNEGMWLLLWLEVSQPPVFTRSLLNLCLQALCTKLLLFVPKWSWPFFCEG